MTEATIESIPEALDPAMAGALSLTPVAAEKVVEIRRAEEIEPHYALRVKVMGGGCAGFQYDLFFDEQARATRSSRATASRWSAIR
jgi:iron-sulfur cluster insertion protein